MQQKLLTPVAPQERIDLIDALRGFALLGVTIANTVALSGFNPYRNPNLIQNPIDKTVFDALLIFIIDGKFYTIFACLFGFGFGLQLLRAQHRNQPFVSIYLRRIGALLLIWLCSSIFLANDNILFEYAIIAILLLLFRNGSDRFLWIAVVISLLFHYYFRDIMALMEIKRPARIDQNVLQQSYQDGDYLSTIGYRIEGLKRYWWNILVAVGSTTCALFIIGYFIARKGYFESVSRYLLQVKRIFWIVLIAVVIGSLCSPYIEKFTGNLPRLVGRAVSGLIITAVAWSKSLFYVTSIILL